MITQLLPPEQIHQALQSVDQRDPRPVIIPELQFLEVEREPCRIDSMVFHQTFFCEGPESFNPVDVDLPVSESFAVVDPLVPKAIGDQAVVPLKAIGMHQAPSLNLLDGEVEESLSF